MQKVNHKKHNDKVVTRNKRDRFHYTLLWSISSKVKNNCLNIVRNIQNMTSKCPNEFKKYFVV